MHNEQNQIKQCQQYKEERFQQSLFKDQIQNIDLTIQDDSKNPNFVKVILICTFTNETIANKEKIICSENETQIIQKDDVVEQYDLSDCIKKEIITYVERTFIECSKLLKSNYIEKLDVIKLPICSANGIRIPNEYDIKQFFKLSLIKNNNEEFTKSIRTMDTKHLFGLLITSLIFQDSHIEEALYEQIFSNINLENAIKLLLINVQYESKKQHYFYKYNKYSSYRLIKHLYYFSKGLLKETYDNHLQKIVQNGMKPKQLQVEKPNFIKLITQQHIFKINSTIFYPLFKQQELYLFKYYKPIRETQLFTVNRTLNFVEGKEQSDYPHLYYLKNNENQTILIAIQYEMTGDILIFQEYQDKFIKYNDNYLGIIEFKNQGKEFIVYDDGYPEYMENSFPQWIGRKKRRMLVFDYFSEKRYDKPRLFYVKCYNINTNQYDEIITKEPHYEESKGAFTLKLKDIAQTPSTRNFILQKKCENNTEQNIYLCHGKQNKHTFHLQLHEGISIFQGFCISVLSICSKGTYQ
ncbi:unnamed protein product [Paramecium sonneborni]|uniref:Tubby C-terminal domain-containing protein n=1 Tax=Paramecium sonneborni TaxID=65129 RepID=A0A8S1PXT0_9CILI|nr:unnamed protein product [Paramecium sonneborni]